MRIRGGWLATTCLAVGVGLAGCGGGGDSSAAKASPEDAARAVADDFWDALNDDDGSRACALIEPQARAKFEALVKGISAEIGCEDAVLYGQNSELGAVTITNAAVSGTTVRVDGTDARGASVKVTLVEVAGEWKINSGFEV